MKLAVRAGAPTRGHVRLSAGLSVLTRAAMRCSVFDRGVRHEHIESIRTPA